MKDNKTVDPTEEISIEAFETFLKDVSAQAITGARKDSEEFWHCVCDCGNTIVISTWEFDSGLINDCGCGIYDKTNGEV